MAIVRRKSSQADTDSEPLTLLQSLEFESSAGVSVYVLDSSGRMQDFSLQYNSLRLTEFVKQLWPAEPLEGHRRAVRFLGDWSQRDFLLKHTTRAILLRSDMGRALIEESRVVLLGLDSSLTFPTLLKELEKHVNAGMEEIRLFQHTILEGLLCANVSLQVLRLRALKPVARNILDTIRLDRVGDSVMQLYPIKTSLSSFAEQLKPLVRCLHSVLEGLDQAHLHDVSKGQPSASFHAVGTEEIFAGQSLPLVPKGLWLEEVLETWHDAAREVLDDVSELTSNVEDAMRFLESSMSCMRNRLLHIENAVMIATFSFTFGNLIAGIFGMNLNNTGGFWNASNWFFACTVGFIAFSCVVISLCLMYWVYKSRHFYEANRAQFGNNKFFQQVGDDDYILSLGQRCARAEDVALRATVLRDLCEPATPMASARPSIGTFSRPSTASCYLAATPGVPLIDSSFR